MAAVKKILVIDDEPDIVELVSYNLKKEGFIVLSASDGEEALDKIRKEVFSRDQLLDALWKDEAFVEPRTVDVHIRRLRTHLEDDPSNPVYIKTRRGIGYYCDPDLSHG